MRRLLLLALPGCACPTWDELRIVEQPAAEGFAEAVQATVDEFAGWTATEGVCIETIELTTTARDGAAGTRQGRRIQVDPTQGELDEVTRHELCHAWDDANDRPSHDHPELFDPESVEASDFYATEELRIQEAFAGECAQGPGWSNALDDFVLEACSTEPRELDALKEWMRANVYPGFATEAAPAYELVDTTVTSAPVAVAEREGFVSVVTAGTSLAALTRAYDDQGIEVTLSLRLLDPATGADIGALPLPAEVDPNYLGLFATAGEDPVVWSAGDGARAWRIARADGTATELPLPARLAGVSALRGYVHGDTAWVQVYTYEASGYTNFALDLVTGALSDIPVPTDAGLPEDLTWDVLAIEGNGYLVAVGDGAAAAVYNFRTGSYGPAVVLGRGLDPLAPVEGGRLFGRLTRASDEGPIVWPVLVDPADGVMRFVASACADRDLGMEARPRPVGDRLYVTDLTGATGGEGADAIFAYEM